MATLVALQVVPRAKPYEANSPDHFKYDNDMKVLQTEKGSISYGNLEVRTPPTVTLPEFSLFDSYPYLWAASTESLSIVTPSETLTAVHEVDGKEVIPSSEVEQQTVQENSEEDIYDVVEIDDDRGRPSRIYFGFHRATGRFSI
ncbi:uncharacterized protein B0I36DRAFT_350736 [Microdochium trichocladiopsis]|uniref:Uncharacterized protein n=1 Tax=Microdochium trichocladiopsis TaxID=1682393 RepID=A0A9P8Y121_9PEZI|nr:uncharacterized protein B0I36DRAFT_350736 [Microdochium trichocladiopsis]KAH7027166.1 hypothetical protein B0I36DRAFT_350736 [Microdochium trichocladiopsis]